MKILKNIKRNIYIYFILVVIFLLLLVFSSFVYKNVSSVNKFNRYINSLYNIPDMYFAQVTYSLEDGPYVDKLEKKYEDGNPYFFPSQVIKAALELDINNEFGITRNGIYLPYSLAITEVKNNEKFNSIAPQQIFFPEEPNLGIFLSSLFGENIEFPLMEGRNFTKEDFKETKFYPVIAGYEYSEEFNIGDTLTLELQKWGEESENNNVPGKIVGFLEEDTELISSSLVPEVIEGNKLILIGVSDEYKIDNTFIDVVFGEYIDGFVETKDPKGTEDKILEFTKSLGYEGKGPILRLIDIEEVYRDTISFNTASFTTYYLIIGISLVATLIITVLVIYLVVRKNRYTYGVLLINGAVKKNIVVSIIIEIMVVLVVSNILAYILSLKYIGEVSLVIFLVFDLIIILLVLISSNLILNSGKIIEFVRSSEKEN